MKNYLILIFAILAAACSSDLIIFSDADPEFDLGAYKTYDWSKNTNIEANQNPVYYNELNDKRIKTAVNKQLTSKKYVHSTNDAELIIHYHIVVNEKVAVLSGEPYNYDPYWTRTSLYAYQEGTLIIDVMDVKTHSLVWRGSAAAPIDDINTSEKVVRLINKAVTKMFRRFPVSRKSEPVPLAVN